MYEVQLQFTPVRTVGEQYAPDKGFALFRLVGHTRHASRVQVNVLSRYWNYNTLRTSLLALCLRTLGNERDRYAIIADYLGTLTRWRFGLRYKEESRE